MPVIVSCKWGKEVYSDINVDLAESPLMFKSQLFALTGVPPEKQKVMIKGALLKDEEWGKATPKDGQQIMLMGSAEAKSVDPPKNLPTFVEDLPESQQEHLATKDYGSGLQNLGNTCYMNSVVQCMYAVQPLRQALVEFKPVIQDPASKLVVAAKELMQDMSSGGEPFAPFLFLQQLRAQFPQFAQQGQGGAFSQQDAEECWTNLMYALREKVKVEGAAQPVVEQLFGIKTLLQLKCEQSEEEMQEEATTYALKCNIDSTINHLHDGITLGLKDDREKHSEVLGCPAVFKGSSVVTRLPPFLTVQMVRFFYKVDTRSKAKVLRKVSFSLELDVYDLCAPELKKTLDGPRAAYKEAQDLAIEATKKLKNSAKAAAAAAAAGTSVVPPSSSATGMEVDTAKPSKAAGSASGSAPMDTDTTLVTGSSSSHVGAETGKYALFGVLTHKGRSADSGHYVAWTKQANGKWALFDDEDITEKSDEDILALSGGGDWHMAYLLLYKAVTVPGPVVSAA
eukprot:CAMPEP_0119108676 /NCGR_PEP_ID=MMETSP1180-20130426/15598_1 /TAXON_ID=3052 ORGANISM="Chlamydomonas cf sp, Strain CCMP681" /NCGR_SAMPLE_ID=MMETSP1180 /ASSEMBLY_ACC=CAM_ASM_000741 /LENGTH=509 /DNA_ID=CAMNT_0007094321 /DNA_START=16 /DNA_END=1548 /DNA_ORIENTATION=-